MKVYEIGFHVGDGIYSVNMVEAEDKQLAELVAEKHAKRHGYTYEWIKELTDAEVEERRRKGMPKYNACRYLERG